MRPSRSPTPGRRRRPRRLPARGRRAARAARASAPRHVLRVDEPETVADPEPRARSGRRANMTSGIASSRGPRGRLTRQANSASAGRSATPWARVSSASPVATEAQPRRPRSASANVPTARRGRGTRRTRRRGRATSGTGRDRAPSDVRRPCRGDARRAGRGRRPRSRRRRARRRDPQGGTAHRARGRALRRATGRAGRRRGARRPVVARFRDAQVPVAVPARPDVHGGAELVETRRVPGAAPRVELVLERENGRSRECPEGEPAPHEDPERRPRRCERAAHGATITEASSGPRANRYRPWLPSPHDQHEAPPPGARPAPAPLRLRRRRPRRAQSPPRRGARCRGGRARRGGIAAGAAVLAFGSRATWPRCARHGSVRTRWSTRPTDRCSA